MALLWLITFKLSMEFSGFGHSSKYSKSMLIRLAWPAITAKCMGVRPFTSFWKAESRNRINPIESPIDFRQINRWIYGFEVFFVIVIFLLKIYLQGKHLSSNSKKDRIFCYTMSKKNRLRNHQGIREYFLENSLLYK